MSSLLPVESIATSLTIKNSDFYAFGHDKGKVSLNYLAGSQPRGKLILVSAITPTPAGEGKTTMSIGLAQGLKKIGCKVALALRQPSMGPVFGRKGGASGGGASTIEPAQSINLHFTGDFHAITSAHNLLTSVIENQLHFGQTELKAEQVIFKRVLDCNDRSLRNIQVKISKEMTRQTGFDITAASEIMAIVCLSKDYADLRQRLEKIVVGFNDEGQPVFAKAFRCIGAMMALLKDALQPNLVQSVEQVPAFVHGGPFANIAHGCNSVLATQMALKETDYAVTEAGFAFDLGGEKFMHIKCRQSGITPAAIVLVATVRALKMHGGVVLDSLNTPNIAALEKGLENLAAHIESARNFQRPIFVAINQFTQDSEEELKLIQTFCQQQGIIASIANVFGQGGQGAVALAKEIDQCLKNQTEFKPLPMLYKVNQPMQQKLEAVAKIIYGAERVEMTEQAKLRLAQFEKAGMADLPLCMAKTQNSLSDDPLKLGRPKDFIISVRDFEIANGAGFIVALTGAMMRMPALPKIPAAEKIDVNLEGEIIGL
jgi:formate--tetrahydrofolate ligase